MTIDTDFQRCNTLKWDDVIVMAQARITLPGRSDVVVEIRRGMRIISIEGKEAGKLAGVAIRQNDREAACLILSHLPEEDGYQSLPVSWIERVEGETIVLNTAFKSILAIPGWHAL